MNIERGKRDRDAERERRGGRDRDTVRGRWGGRGRAMGRGKDRKGEREIER